VPLGGALTLLSREGYRPACFWMKAHPVSETAARPHTRKPDASQPM